MNTSQRTRLIAEGIALYAAYMDKPLDDDTPERKAWNEWRRAMQAQGRYQEVEFVRKEQYALFDRINARSWEPWSQEEVG